MPNYQWVTLSNAVAALAGRLADPTNVFWSQPELTLYIQEALSTWNALTEQWNADFVWTPDSSQVWYNVDQLPNSPRVRTLTDVDLYTSMEYMLLEPPSGGTWTGTSQFSISDLSGALQRRRDEMIQESGCNLSQLPAINTTPNTRRIFFPDSTLEPRRARWVPVSGSPQTLSRGDNLGWDSFEAAHLQQTGTPYSWSVIAGPPLAMDVDIAPNQPGSYDVLSLQAGSAFAPPVATLLNLPNDWGWLAKWGALADLLGRESEATDRQRADYCLKRYQQGLEIMKEANWLLLATINNVPVDTPSVKDLDGFAPEWENDPTAWPAVVTAGMDLIAACPPINAAPVIQFIGSATVTAPFGNLPHTLTLSYQSGVGTTLVLFVGIGTNSGNASGVTVKVTDSAGNTWQQLSVNPASALTLQCWSTVPEAAISFITIMFSGTGSYGFAVGVSEYSDVSGGAIGITQPEGFSSPAGVSRLLTYANDYLVLGCFSRSDLTFSPGANGSFRYTATNGVGASLGSGDATDSSVGSVEISLDYTPSSELWIGIALELVGATTPNISAKLTVVGNAPLPVEPGDFIQVSRDVYDVILDYAQVLASFKQGGEEFASTKDLEMNFFQAALATNKRLAKMGVFADMLHLQGNRQNVDQPR